MFTGFTEKTGEFLWGLKLNNEKPWFESHKAEFIEVLRDPLTELARETCALMQSRHPKKQMDLHISRIYRDARRLHGRGPYKDHMWFSIKSWGGLLEGPMFWFEVGAADYGYGMGFYSAKAGQMERFRASIDAEPARFDRLARMLNKQTVFRAEGEMYARPKGDLGDTLNPWYNCRRIGLSREENFGGDLLRRDLPQMLADDFELLMPLYDYLCRFCVDGVEK